MLSLFLLNFVSTVTLIHVDRQLINCCLHVFLHLRLSSSSPPAWHTLALCWQCGAKWPSMCNLLNHLAYHLLYRFMSLTGDAWHLLGTSDHHPPLHLRFCLFVLDYFTCTFTFDFNFNVINCYSSLTHSLVSKFSPHPQLNFTVHALTACLSNVSSHWFTFLVSCSRHSTLIEPFLCFLCLLSSLTLFLSLYRYKCTIESPPDELATDATYFYLWSDFVWFHLLSVPLAPIANNCLLFLNVSSVTPLLRTQ